MNGPPSSSKRSGHGGSRLSGHLHAQSRRRRIRLVEIIASELAERGSPIGEFDVLSLELTLVTNNVNRFNRIDGLNVESWY